MLWQRYREALSWPERSATPASETASPPTVRIRLPDRPAGGRAAPRALPPQPWARGSRRGGCADGDRQARPTVPARRTRCRDGCPSVTSTARQPGGGSPDRCSRTDLNMPAWPVIAVDLESPRAIFRSPRASAEGTRLLCACCRSSAIVTVLSLAAANALSALSAAWHGTAYRSPPGHGVAGYKAQKRLPSGSASTVQRRCGSSHCQVARGRSAPRCPRLRRGEHPHAPCPERAGDRRPE